jgi:hypothetical protein
VVASCRHRRLRNSPSGASLSASIGVSVFSLGYILIMAGLAFGGAVALVGFGGLLLTWFHRSLGSPLPLPTLHNAFEARLYIAVGTAGVLLWAGAFVCSLKFAP